MPKQKILILGVTGMLGHTLFRKLLASGRHEVHGTARSLAGLEGFFTREERGLVRQSVDAGDFDSVVGALGAVRPDTVVNCIGLIKQTPLGSDPLASITINAQLPHRLAGLCRAAGARLIQISTDCVFDGRAGNYREADLPAPTDLYGQSKLLGETAYPHCLTLRTSIIGHELKEKLGLVEWFLGQTGAVRGYTRAIYSGFPTVEMARIIDQYVLSDRDLSGIYHLSSEPIAKYDLLQLIKKHYHLATVIEPYDGFSCDRSLNSDRFRSCTGYAPPDWETLVSSMRSDFSSSFGM